MKAECEYSSGESIDLLPFQRAVSRATEIVKEAEMKEMAFSNRMPNDTLCREAGQKDAR
jgi:hypothetical protein